MPLARLNGININYQVEGQGDPLVMIMGFTAGRIGWMPQIRFFIFCCDIWEVILERCITDAGTIMVVKRFMKITNFAGVADHFPNPRRAAAMRTGYKYR